MDLEALRSAVATLVATLDGFRSSAIVTSTVSPGDGVLVLVVPGTGFVSDAALGGAQDVELNLIVVTNRVSDRAGQNRLDNSVATLRDLVDSAAHGTYWDFLASGEPFDYGNYNFGLGDAVQSYYGYTLPVTAACP